MKTRILINGLSPGVWFGIRWRCFWGDCRDLFTGDRRRTREIYRRILPGRKCRQCGGEMLVVWRTRPGTIFCMDCRHREIVD